MTAGLDVQIREEQAARVARLAGVACWLGAIVAGVAALVLAGWALRVQTLRAVVPGLATMKPDTAMALAVLGVGVMTMAGARRERWRRAARWAAWVVAAFMAATLVEYVLERDFGINAWMMSALGRGAEAATGRGGGGTRWAPLMAPSPATATGLLCAALAVGLMKDAARKRVRSWEVLAGMSGVIGLVATIGYVIGVEELYQFGLFFSTAMHTAACLVLLSVALLCARAEGGAMGVMTSSLAGGQMARRLVPLAGLAPLLLAWLALRGHRAGWYAEGVEIALLGSACAVVLAAAALWTAASLNRSDAARRAGEARQLLMMAELDHRVKNNLAAVLGLAELTIGSAESLPAFAATFTGRVRAMARTHEALAATRWAGVRLRDVVRMTVEPMADGGNRLDVDGEDVLLPSRASSALCAMLHELATNAAKYGAFSTPHGRVRVSWDVDGERMLRLEWRETGVDGIREPTRRGFGTELIRGSVTHELQGDVEMEYRPPGLRCRIRVPLSLVEAGSPDEARSRELV